MHEVSIIDPCTQPTLFSAEDTQKASLVALIDPPCDIILMDERIAQLRSLRGFSPLTQLMPKGPRVEIAGRMYQKRRSKIEESERQAARISISHDREYATAMCIALDQPSRETSSKLVIDDGQGSPLHEPDWGDEGWLYQDMVDHLEKKPVN